MQPTIIVVLGDEEFALKGLKVQEMAKVEAWTQIKNRREFYAALGEEQSTALIAAYCLAKARKGETVRFTDGDFDLDDLSARFVDDDGREVEPVFEENKDGSVKTDKDGTPVPKVDTQGNPLYVYADSKEPVPTGA